MTPSETRNSENHSPKRTSAFICRSAAHLRHQKMGKLQAMNTAKIPQVRGALFSIQTLLDGIAIDIALGQADGRKSFLHLVNRRAMLFNHTQRHD